MRRLLIAGGLGAALVIATLASPLDAAPPSFTETFDGAPATPTPWHPVGWDIQTQVRNSAPSMDSMHAGHGTDCAGPPAVHQITEFPDAVFGCRDHMMTAFNDDEYGMLYVTPPAMVDLSSGSATIKFDLSTLETASRDWWDVWITPYDDNLALPLEVWLPDVQGPPKNALHIVGGSHALKAELFVDGVEHRVDLPGWWRKNTEWLTPDAARRDTYEITFTLSTLTLGMPAYDQWWAQAAPLPAPITWTQGVVQVGHHSYNPTKDCGTANNSDTGTCSANTWHWDNFSINPSVPFSIATATPRQTRTSGTVTFAQPAPANSHFRFAAVGRVELSWNGGASWVPALRQWQSVDRPNLMSSYWTPTPEGATSVRVRISQDDWYVGAYVLNDPAIWSTAAASPPPTTTTSTVPPSTTVASTTTVPRTTLPATTTTRVTTTTTIPVSTCRAQWYDPKARAWANVPPTKPTTKAACKVA